MGKSKEVLGTQLSHEQRQRCGEILQTIWGIRGQQEHQNIDLRFFHSWQQGDRYGRESGWRGSRAKASPKRFCDQLNVVICGWKYGTVLRPHACGCQHHSYHSYVHRFWERTCKGTFQGSSQRTLQGFPITIHGAEKLDTLAEIPEPKKKPAKKTLGELILAKCYPYEIAWHTRQPKEPKRARGSCSEKKGAREPKWRSQQLFGTRRWRPGCLPHRAFIISERPLWPSSCEPQLEVTQSQSQNQSPSPSPSQTLRLMDWNFFTS